ncbi:MAG: BamA/TamA family outer membrane protein [Polyangiaceae bacterium]|nr:BamA/TamA family outer membrane protein [Polyangiaceae bacterium]
MRKPFPEGRRIVSEVDVRASSAEDRAALRAGIATSESKRFLGIWDGVGLAYEVLDEDVLARDLLRIERYYRARGYYDAKVIAARVVALDERRVRVEVEIVEGEPVIVRSRRVLGAERAAGAVEAASAVTLEEGRRFDEADLEDSKKALVDILGDHGHAFAEVTAKVTLDLGRKTADVVLEVRPGPPARYGPISIVGLAEVPEDVVREIFALEPGRPFRRQEVVAAQRALVDLGVFASVRVEEDRARPETGVVPLRVVVVESTLRRLELGGGVRFDQIRLANRLRAGWEDKNFLGELRSLSIDTRPGVTWFPTRLPGGSADESGVLAPERPLLENQLNATLRRPAFLEARTTGFVHAAYNVYPLLYANLAADERIIGYHELRGRPGVERSFFDGHLFVTPSYNLQANFPFVYAGGADDRKPEGLERVIVSFPELLVALDLRDDRIQPRNGAYLATSLQSAGYIFQGDVSDVRLRPELRLYKELFPGRAVLAVRGLLGLLFPSNYGETLDTAGESGADLRRIDDPDVVRDQHRLLFRAFYSGGPGSNRGYPLNGVGPHGPLGFLAAGAVDCRIDPADPDAILARTECLRPLGGVTLWEASAEVRVAISGPFEAAFFADASSVTRRTSEINRLAPHLSTGVGLRYVSAIGPLRLDFGYRVPGLQVVGRRYETLAEIPVAQRDTERPVFPEFGNAGTLFGLPAAVHLAIGEAF